MEMRTGAGWIAAVCAGFAASGSLATPVTFTGSGTSAASGANLSASATFDVVGGNLTVTLTNTSNDDVTVQGDVLTAVFFSVSGPALGLNSMAGSAVLAPGSGVYFGGTDPGDVVGGE